MGTETIPSFMTLVQVATPLVALLVALWAAFTAWRSRKIAVSPCIVCFIRQQPASHVVDFVIQNTGSGNAYNVAWEIEADEEDFRLHVGRIGPPLKKVVPFSVIEAGGYRATSFGSLPSLLNTQGSDDVAMKPFTVTATFEWFEWTFLWTKRRRDGKTKQEIDVRQFADVVWNVGEDHVAKAAEGAGGLGIQALAARGTTLSAA